MVSPGKLLNVLGNLLFKTQYKLFSVIYGDKPITIETIEMGLRIFQPKRVKGYDVESSRIKVLAFLPSLIETNQWAKTLANNLEKDDKINSLFYSCSAENYFIYDWVRTIEGQSQEHYVDILMELKSHLQRVVAYVKSEPRTSTASQINRRVIQGQLTNIAVLVDSLNQCSL